jgi:hypothetical protein
MAVVVSGVPSSRVKGACVSRHLNDDLICDSYHIEMSTNARPLSSLRCLLTHTLQHTRPDNTHAPTTRLAHTPDNTTLPTTWRQ